MLVGYDSSLCALGGRRLPASLRSGHPGAIVLELNGGGLGSDGEVDLDVDQQEEDRSVLEGRIPAVQPVEKVGSLDRQERTSPTGSKEAAFFEPRWQHPNNKEKLLTRTALRKEPQTYRQRRFAGS